MEIVTSIAALRKSLQQWRNTGKRVGFVPTMGALHDGHLSLVSIARKHADVVAMSIFVNPTQFNSSDDFANYPRDLDGDVEKARGAGCDLLFVPDATELYRGHDGPTTVRAGERSAGLCGAARPGHFDGVVTVVSILFNLVSPHVAVFGEKDYQQLKVIEALVSDLHFDITIVPGPTIRDADNLALSSRNLRLAATDRYHALYIPQTLFKAQEIVHNGERSVSRVREMVRDNLERSGGLRIDYVEIVDPDTLKPIADLHKTARLLVAVFVGPVRLIDNVALTIQDR